MGKFGKIIAGITGTILVAGAGIGIGCAVNKDFKTKVDNTKNKIIEFFKRETKQDLRKQIKELLEEIDNLKFENEQKIKDFTLKVETLTAEKTTLQAEKEDLQKQLAEKQARIEELESQGLIDSEELERLNAEITAINNRIAELEARVTVLEQQEVTLRNTIAELEATLNDLTIQVDNLWNIFENYQTYVEDGEEAENIELTEEEKQIVEDRLEELESEVAEKTTQSQEIENQKIVINNQINNLKEEKIVYETNINNYYDQIIVNNNQIKLLTNQNSDYQKQIDENDDRIEYIENLGENINDDERQQLEDLKSQNSTLQERIINNNTTISNAQNSNNEYQAQIDNANTQLDSLEARIEILESEYLALELQAESINKDIDSLQNQIDKFDKFLNKANGNDNENEEKPPVTGDLTLNIQGETQLNLPLANMQSADEITSVISNEQYLYEELPKEDDFSGLFTIFPNATNIYMVANAADENVKSLVILFENEVEAESIFTIFEANKEIFLDDGIQLNCVAQCGTVGIIEITEIPCEHIPGEVQTYLQGEDESTYYYLDVIHCVNCGTQLSSNYYSVSKETTDNSTTTDEFGVTSTGTSIFNLPIYRMTSYDAIIGYFEGNTNYGYQDLSEDADEPKAMFKGSQNFIGVMQVGNENTQGMFIVYDSEANAKDIFSSLEANKEIILGDNLTLEYAAQVKNIGYFELRYNGSTVECSHAATSQSQENYYETDTEIIYDLVTICQECGKEVSRETITETKSTNYTAVNEEELIVALNTANDGDIININGLISLSSPLTINKNITINGGIIEGSPIYVKANNVTISNVSFNGIFKQNETQDSSIYASNFSGSLNIEYCNFNTSEWESIQITPTAGASIKINNCNFSSSNANQQRFIHIEGKKDEIVDCKIQIVNNNFNNLDILDTADENQNNGEAIGVYYVNLDNVICENNTFNGNLSVESLKAKVCIANESPWQTSESTLKKNTFNSLLEV